MGELISRFTVPALLFFASGCSCDAGLGEKCSTQDDCAHGLYCAAGHCASEPGEDGGVGAGDGGVDAGPPGSIEEIPIDQEIEMPDLEAPADVIVDVHGMPHIYAESLHDATLAEGYMMARDRLIQLELGRRQASGTLTELAGALAPSLIEDDIFMRVMGLRRQAEAIVAAVEPGSDVEAALAGYSSGVNGYLARLREGDERVPDAISIVLPPEVIGDWTPVDSLVMGVFQSYTLGFDDGLDADYTAFFQGLSDTFTEDAINPALAARAGAALDLARISPPELVSVQDGFPGGVDLDWRTPPAPIPIPRVTPAELRQTRHASAIARRIARRWGRSADYGSNNWVVSGEHTESGAALMANDTHLGLSEPSIFYQVHLNAKRGEGADGLNAAGDTFAGVPGVILGFNEHVAWGATTAYFDATDLYAETLTPGDPSSVEFEGGQVPLEIIPEDIPNAFGGTVHIDIEWVPHHGPLVPDIQDGHLVPHEGPSVLSWRWTGFDALTDPSAQHVYDPFLGAARARDVHDFDAAWDQFSSAPHNWVVADTDGNILWTTKSRAPVRDPRAMTFDAETGTGIAPCFVLPGTGEAEWQGNLDLADVPHDLNPARGYIATANNDQVGATFDGNPFNDAHYVGWSYSESGAHRIARIVSRLDDLIAAGGITAQDMQGVQAEARSPLGARIVPFLLAAMARADEEASTPGTHSDLTEVVADASDRWERLVAVRDRLAAWQFDTPAAVEGEPSEDEIAESIATSIFNVTIVDLLPRVFGDELEAASIELTDWTYQLSGVLLTMLEAPDTMHTYDEVGGASVLWDDLSTASALESRDADLVSSLVDALTDLEDLLGDDDGQWRWGRLHTLRLASAVPGFLPDIPAVDDPRFPDGFPRHGDNFVVDAAASGLDDLDFSYQGGPAIRTVVELTAGAVHAESVIPGGQSSDPTSPHFSDEMELWRQNQTHPIPIDDEGVLETYASRIRLSPP